MGQFEDLVAWQKARELVKEIYGITGSGDFGRDFGLSGQIQRAAVSVMANIAEGFERGGRGEFSHFLLAAKGSCGEVRSHLYIASDVGYLDRETFARLRGMADELSRVINGLCSTVQQQRVRKKE